MLQEEREWIEIIDKSIGFIEKRISYYKTNLTFIYHAIYIRNLDCNNVIQQERKGVVWIILNENYLIQLLHRLSEHKL